MATPSLQPRAPRSLNLAGLQTSCSVGEAAGTVPQQAASETRGSRRCECPAVALSYRAYEQERRQILHGSREEESLSAGKDSRTGTDTSVCYYFLVAMGIWEKAVCILYSTTRAKSRCEQYRLFTAYNFLLQVQLSSFVWGRVLIIFSPLFTC